MSQETEKKYQDVLVFIDEQGEDLTSHEIDYVADLIDNPRTLVTTDFAKLRSLLARRAGGWSAFNVYLHNITVERACSE